MTQTSQQRDPHVCAETSKHIQINSHAQKSLTNDLHYVRLLYYVADILIPPAFCIQSFFYIIDL